MRQVLILGAVGPLGCRLAEALCDRGLTVVTLVDDWTRAPRLARLPVRMIEGRVADREALARAMAGCDAVFHCAGEELSRGGVESRWHLWARAVGSVFSSSRKKLVCTDAVLSVALQSRIGRVVCVDAEDGPAALESDALRSYRERGLSVTVLRAATLYGPFCPWTIGAARALRRGRKPRGGPARCLYVDHLVEATLLAAGTDASAAEVFHLHDREPASCEELAEAHARAFEGDRDPASLTRTGEKPDAPTDAELQRAHRLLGYDPSSGFAQNMERTAAWIQWSRL